MDLKDFDESQLLGLFADIMDELSKRNVIRSANNPVSDYAETIAARKLGLRLVGASNKGFDALDESGKRYQIKARRLVGSKSRQLGVIRNLKEKPFDYCVAILLDRLFRVVEAYRIPRDVIEKYAKWSEHQHGHILQLRPPLVEVVSVDNITQQFA